MCKVVTGLSLRPNNFIHYFWGNAVQSFIHFCCKGKSISKVYIPKDIVHALYQSYYLLNDYQISICMLLTEKYQTRAMNCTSKMIACNKKCQRNFFCEIRGPVSKRSCMYTTVKYPYSFKYVHVPSLEKNCAGLVVISCI